MRQSRPSSRPMLSLPQAVRQCLRSYAQFKGRASRAEFWWWVLVSNLAIVAAAMVDSVLTVIFLALGVPFIGPLAFLLIIGVLLPSLAVAVRRLHDIGRSGWWLLAWYGIDFVASLVFVVSLVLLVVFFAFGFGGENGFLVSQSAGSWILLIFALALSLVALAAILAVYVWALVWLVRQGQPGPNQHGPDPRAWNDEEESHP